MFQCSSDIFSMVNIESITGQYDAKKICAGKDQQFAEYIGPLQMVKSTGRYLTMYHCLGSLGFKFVTRWTKGTNSYSKAYISLTAIRYTLPLPMGAPPGRPSPVLINA